MYYQKRGISVYLRFFSHSNFDENDEYNPTDQVDHDPISPDS
jgi:hypothetical protein